MDYKQILLLVTFVFIIAGGIFLFLKLRSRAIPQKIQDELRRELWKEEKTMLSVKNLSLWYALKIFGFAVLPNASYSQSWFLEVLAADQEQKKETMQVRIVLVFEKEITEIEWKKKNAIGKSRSLKNPVGKGK